MEGQYLIRRTSVTAVTRYRSQLQLNCTNKAVAADSNLPGCYARCTGIHLLTFRGS